MSVIRMTKDLGEATTVLRTLVEGATIVAFEYAATQFSIRLEAGKKEPTGMPQELLLALNSEWWVGSRELFGQEAARIPFHSVRLQSEYLARACALTAAMGSEVARVDLSADGSLELATSDGEVFHISGRETVFDESWLLLAEPGQPNSDDWSVVCDSSGEVYARSPEGPLTTE